MRELFTRYGDDFTGRVFTNPKGQPCHAVRITCGRCGGAGGADKWAMTGWTCYDCGGVGHRGDRLARLYTREELDKLNAAVAKRRATNEAKRAASAAELQAEAEARRAAWEAEHAEILALWREWAPRSEFVADVLASAVQRCHFSDAQVDAVSASIMVEMERDRIRAMDAASKWLAQPGKRITSTVEVERVHQFERTRYGAPSEVEHVAIVTMRDEDGNVLVYKGTSWWPKKGERLTIKATVKAHDYYRDTRQTTVSRVAVQ